MHSITAMDCILNCVQRVFDKLETNTPNNVFTIFQTCMALSKIYLKAKEIPIKFFI